VAHRTARIVLRVTPAQARRCYSMLRSGGDVWAALIELNEHRFRRHARPLLNYQELCREVAGVQVGELSVPALRSVVRAYADVKALAPQAAEQAVAGLERDKRYLQDTY